MQDSILFSTSLNKRAEMLDDATLLQRSRAGGQNAFRMLVDRYHTKVLSTVTHVLGKNDETRQVGHDVFVRFYKALDTLPDDTNVPGYLHKIAVNLSLNALKRRTKWHQRFTSLDGVKPHHEPTDEGTSHLESKDHATFVHAAIQHLPPKLRAVVVLRLVQEFSTQETASMLQIPEGTVMSRLSRAQAKLRSILKPYIKE